MTSMLDCGAHGKRPWKGHIVCASCGRVYQTSDENAPHFAPPDCVCGARLMPYKDKSKKGWAARSICETCYDDRRKAS